jgi:MFS transporter, DHA1 family, inner membrane transport protein
MQGSIASNSHRDRNTIDRIHVFLAGGILSGFAAVMWEISSQFSYMLGLTQGFGESAQGDFLAAFFTGFTLISVSMVFWIRRFNWRVVGLVGCSVALTSFLALQFVHSYWGIVATLLVAGLGMGSNYTLSLTLFSDSSQVDRAFGFKFFCDVVPGIVMNFFLPAMFAFGGIAAVLWALAGCNGISGIASAFLPQHGARATSAVVNPLKKPGVTLPILACLACFIQIVGVMALWSFLGQIGASKGFPISTLGKMFSTGSALGGVGALVATWIGNRLGRITPVVTTIAANLVVLFVLGSTSHFAPFLVGCLVFFVTNNFTSVYVLSSVTAVDKGGAFVPFAAACFCAGSIVGPFLAGRLLERQGLSAMLMLPAVMWGATVALLLYVRAAAWRRDKRHADLAAAKIPLKLPPI